MIKTINMTANVKANREVKITLPADVPVGPAEIVVVVSSLVSVTAHTLGELLHSEFFGMWRDRDEMGDSVEFALRLRAEGWSRAD